MDSKRDNTGIPPVPHGVKRSQNGSSQTARGRRGRIVVYGQKDPVAPKQPPLWQGFLLVILGALVCSYFAFIGAALMSYGIVVTCYQRSLKEALNASGVALLVAGGTSYLSGGFDVLISTLCASCIAIGVGVSVARGSSTISTNFLIVAVGTLLLLGGHAFLAATEGSSLPARVQEALEFYRSQYAGMSINNSEGFAYLKGLMQLFWPTSFTIASFLYYLIARIGAQGAYHYLGGDKKRLPRFVEYDVPLWFVALGIAALAAYAASSALPVYGDTVLQVAVNILVPVRFVLMIQGVAVGVWFMQQRKISPVLAMILFIFAAFLEIQVGMLAFVGLADIWANFRHLPRGGMSGGEKTTDTENQSAHVG